MIPHDGAQLITTTRSAGIHGMLNSLRRLLFFPSHFPAFARLKSTPPTGRSHDKCIYYICIYMPGGGGTAVSTAGTEKQTKREKKKNYWSQKVVTERCNHAEHFDPTAH